jgi:DNA-binding transcriptional MocR family regulator
VKTVEQALRAMLQQQTASGLLGPGGKLPTERDLAGQLAAPRSEIRRALALLDQDGLITRQVGRGTFLTEVASHQFNGAPPDTSPAEIMQTRLLIERPAWPTRPTWTASPGTWRQAGAAAATRTSSARTPTCTGPSPNPSTTNC